MATELQLSNISFLKKLISNIAAFCDQNYQEQTIPYLALAFLGFLKIRILHDSFLGTS